jgi:ribonuclease VapC
MIAVDTSALVAIVQGEVQADACAEVLASGDRLLISAMTLAEALIVANARNFRDDMLRLIDGLGFEVIAVTDDTARRVASSYAVWGKGIHPASLNFGDCFAYQVAKDHGCPLLFIGDDFSRTDIPSAL